MTLDWILNPLTQYILCSVCLGGSLLLWISFKKELQAVRFNSKKSYDQLDANVRELSTGLDAIRETHRQAEPVPSAQSAYPGFDVARRTEVLRMSRRNAPVTAIATALRLPRNEVELLVKIERLLNHETY